ncbi:coiled-coil domain-containing protein 190 [Lissotriton helveticus]
MQRSNTQGQATDKQWEIGRRDDRRTDVRLSHGLQDIEEARRYHINNMAWEKKRVQQDLLRIRQAGTVSKKSFAAGALSIKKKGGWHGHPTTTNFAHIPNMNDERAESFPTNEPVAESNTSSSLQTRINDFFSTTNSSKSKTPSVDPSSSLTGESSSEDSDVVNVKQLMANRMSLSAKAATAAEASKDKAHTAEASKYKGQKGTTQIGTSTKNSIDESILAATDGQSSNQSSSYSPRRTSVPEGAQAYDEEIYAPDGFPRTMLTMPDFETAIEQAKKARYIRYRVNPEWNKELSVEEVFERKNNQESSDAQEKKAGGS